MWFRENQSASWCACCVVGGGRSDSRHSRQRALPVRCIDAMMIQMPLPPPPPTSAFVVPSAPSKNPFDDDDDVDDMSPQHPLHARSSVGSGRARHRATPGGSASSPGTSAIDPPAGPCQRCSDCCFKCTARCTRVLLVGPNLLFLVRITAFSRPQYKTYY